MTDTRAPELDDLRAAHERIAPHVHRTPVMTSRQLDDICGASVFFKCEQLQKVGAFKARGATNAVLSLGNAEAEKGVGTHSSGNHGAALALAAKVRGIPAYVVMPANAPAVKKAAVAGYGGLIVECEPTLAARAATLEGLVAEHDLHVVHRGPGVTRPGTRSRRYRGARWRRRPAGGNRYRRQSHQSGYRGDRR